MGIEVVLQAPILEHAAAVLFGAEHVDDLPTPGDQFAMGTRFLIGYGPGERTRQRA